MNGKASPSAKNRKAYVVDGRRCTTLKDTAAEFTNALELSMPWMGNLDAFNDFLNGGFGTPEEGFVLVWRHADIARQHLGYGATISWFEETIKHCHPSNIPQLRRRMDVARQQQGQTLFDWLVDIIRGHEDIELRLE